MASHINLIGSIIIGALLLLAILNLNSTMTAKSYEHTLDNIVRESTSSIAEMLCFDLRKIGFGVTNPADIIRNYDSTSIGFWSDIDADGNMDSIFYSISDTLAASGTSNPHDRFLYRQFNTGSPVNIGFGVTDFKLRYFDRDGAEAAAAGDITTIQIELTVESIVACNVYNTTYFARNYWQTRITPPNLLR